MDCLGGLVKKSEKFVSLIPVVGGLIGVVGILILPIPGARHFWWVPPIVDLGCGLMLVAFLAEMFKDMIRRKKH